MNTIVQAFKNKSNKQTNKQNHRGLSHPLKKEIQGNHTAKHNFKIKYPVTLLISYAL